MSFGQTTVAGATAFAMNGQGSPRLVYGRSHTPVADEQVISIRAYLNAALISGPSSCKIGLFDISAGKATGVRVAEVSIPVTVGLTTNWYSAALSYTLEAGKTYAYAFVSGTNASWNLFRSAVGGDGKVESYSTSAYAIPATWSATVSASTVDALIEVVTVSQLINSTNSGNPVKAGDTFSSSVTGFTGVASGTIGGKSLTGLSYSSNTITATAPVYVDGQTFYEPDTDQTLTYVNGSETASATIPTASPDGMTSVVIASPITTDPTYIGNVYTLADDDRWVYPTLDGDFFVDADGKINALNAGTYVCWHWREVDSIMTQVTLNISEAGEIVSVGCLTTRLIVGNKLTVSRLVVRRI